MNFKSPVLPQLRDVHIDKLILDSANPRHEPLDDESDVICQLYEKEQVLNLSKDIAEKGTLSPLELTGVIEMDGMPGHYIVIEGNRRICALKLLHTPDKAPTVSAQRAFEKLAQRFDVPLTLPVVVFPDRDAARPWIALRHLGGQDGAGTRPWDSAQQARYAEAESPNKLALAILDLAQDSGWISVQDRERISITTLTRYLGTSLVRAALGLGSNKEIIYTHEASEVEAALRQFLADATHSLNGDKPVIHSRSNKKQRENYAMELNARGISPRTLAPLANGHDKRSDKSAPPRPKRVSHPDERPYLLPSDFPIRVKDKPLVRLSKELRTTPIEGHVYAINYLLRAFIERVLVIYSKSFDFHQSGLQDLALLRRCIDELEKNGHSGNALKSMRIAASDKNAAHSLHSLGAAVHANHLPTKKDLIAAWENWETALKIMLDQL